MCRTSSDNYVRAGCLEFEDRLAHIGIQQDSGVKTNNKDQAPKESKQTAEGYKLVTGESLIFDDFPELDGVLYALTIYDREQFFELYENTRSLEVSVVTIGISIVGLCVQQTLQKKGLVPYSSADLDSEVYTKFEKLTAGNEMTGLRERLQQYILALECQITSSELKLEQYAFEFMGDVMTGAEVEMHTVSYLWGLRIQAYLVPIFRVFSTPMYWVVVNSAMVLLVVLRSSDICMPAVQIWPLMILIADAAATAVFCFMLAQGFEVHIQVFPITMVQASL